jgi:hypothetical protein
MLKQLKSFIIKLLLFFHYYQNLRENNGMLFRKTQKA